MMSNRASILDTGLDLDLSEFTPKPTSEPVPSAAQVKKLSEENNFRSREVARPKADRRYRSGRTEQLHLKARPEVAEMFFRLCAEVDVKQVEGFELAIRAWQRETK